jgi:glycosyltransferase involved in cell wall biosynthesis
MKILWVKAGGLLPLDTGGKIRSYHILRELARRHEVTFFTCYAKHDNDVHGELDQVFAKVIRHRLRVPRIGGVGQIAQYARDIVSGRPHQLSRYYCSQAFRGLLRLLEVEGFDVVVCDFLAAATMIPWRFPVPKVLFTHNVEAIIWKRHGAVARNPFWKAICWREYRTTALAERHYLNLADQVLTVSEMDRNSFAQTIEESKLTVIPTGVDLNYFQAGEQVEESNTLVFTGSMDWMPNEDGIVYFVKEILPRIRHRISNVSLLVVGRSPSRQLQALAKATENMQVTGSVEDIRPHVGRAAAYIVPLRVGSGTRLKIFEAMAMGKAVVSTSIGAEGLPVQHGRNIIIADSPAEFSNGVIEVLQNPVRRGELGRAARQLVEQKHGWDSVARHFELSLEKSMRPAGIFVNRDRVGTAKSIAARAAGG